MRMLKSLVVAAILTLAVAAGAMAETSPRYTLKPGMTLRQTISSYQRALNRAVGFSGADCWLYDGNAKTGWRHAACVGNYSNAGTIYRFKLTRTPVSCSRERVTFVIPGVHRETSRPAWNHRYFNCKPG
jgi:hypothetical protein